MSVDSVSLVAVLFSCRPSGKKEHFVYMCVGGGLGMQPKGSE